MEGWKEILGIVCGVGFIELLRFIITARSVKAKANAEACSAGLDNEQKKDEAVYKLLDEMRKNYESINGEKDRQLTKIEYRVGQLEKKVEEQSALIVTERRRVSKKNYIIRQAHKCVRMERPLDCPVLAKMEQIDSEKDKKIEQQ